MIFQSIINFSAIFENGDEQEINSIIFATGFKINIPFFDDIMLQKLRYDQNDQIQPLILYKGTVHPDLQNIFFVGMYKGRYFAVIEQQAKWACKIFSQEISLPHKDEMLKGLQEEMAIREQLPRPQFPHSDYVNFADSIAIAADNFPNLEKFNSEPSTFAETMRKNYENSLYLENNKVEIYKKFMTSPVTPIHYNLRDNPFKTIEGINLLKENIAEIIALGGNLPIYDL